MPYAFSIPTPRMAPSGAALAVRSQRWSNASLLVAFLMMTGAFLWMWTGEQQFILSSDQSSFARYYGYPRYMIFASMLVWFHYKGVLGRLFRDSRSIWLFSLYFGLTLFWSEDISNAGRAYAVYLMQLVFGMALCIDYNAEKTFQRLRWLAVAYLVINIGFAVALPAYGFESHGYTGALRGIFSGKNEFGMLTANFAVVFLIACLRPDRRLIDFAWLGLCLAFIVVSRSATSLIAFAVAVFAIGICIAIYTVPGRSARLLVIGVGGILMLLLGLNAHTIVASTAELIGRDPTLTGRAELWEFVHRVGTEHPIFGYGFDSFWWRFVGSDNMLTQLGLWQVAEAHNTALENYLSGGIVGVALWVGLMLFLAVILVRRLMTSPLSIATMLSLAWFLQILIQGNTESIFPFPMQVAGTWLTVILILAAPPRKGLPERPLRAQTATALWRAPMARAGTPTAMVPGGSE